MARQQFELRLGNTSIDRLVFLDESGAKTNMTRRYGRSLRGQRCHFLVPHGHWQTTTMISAIRCSGVILESTMVFDGPTDGMIFRGYVERCLAPALTPGDVVVMDNLSAHKVEGIEQAIESRGATLVYLPPYSPDFSPIEQCWSEVKTWLRKDKARDAEALDKAIVDALGEVTKSDAKGWFQHCGYAVHAT